jgi:hypothetical protein
MLGHVLAPHQANLVLWWCLGQLNIQTVHACRQDCSLQIQLRATFSTGLTPNKQGAAKEHSILAEAPMNPKKGPLKTLKFHEGGENNTHTHFLIINDLFAASIVSGREFFLE